MQYKSIAFGESEVIKPDSYKLLDSLHEIKYRNENRGIYSKSLDQEISHQRLIVVNDTNPIYYVENHVWELSKNDTSEFYAGKFILNVKDEIVDVEITESTELPSSYSALYKSYVYEESMISPGFSANQSELQFYSLYKSHAATLGEPEKSLFVKHTLDLMNIAKTTKTLVTVDLIKALLLEKTTNKSYAVKNVIFSKMEELYGSGMDNQILGYNITFSFQMEENGITQQHEYYAQLDPYLQIILLEKIK